MRRRLEIGVWLLAAAPVVWFYSWTATSSWGPFEWRNDKVDHYNLLADGFLSGHLYMKLDPPPELLALRDPYDPLTNAALRKHDASLYHGKYYLYFGPVPALALFVPAKLLADVSLPENFAVVLFVTAGYAFSCLLLVLLLELSGVRVPLWLLGVAFAGLGLAQFTPILLRRPMVYEVAIAAGFCFLTGGLYFLARDTPLCALLAGILLGLAPGCRPHFAIAVALLCVLFVRRGWLLVAPVAACGAGLAAYNYARFGSVFEFGQRYQLAASVHNEIHLSLRNVLPDLYDLLFYRPVKLDGFPFYRLRISSFGEPTAGMAVVMPLCLIGCVAAAFAIGRKRWMDRQVTRTLASLFVTAGAILLFLCLTGTSNLRYQVDYTPILWVAGLFVLLLISARAASPWVRRGTAALVVAGCLWGAAAAALLSINGYESGLEMMNPQAFHEMAAWFGDSPRARVP